MKHFSLLPLLLLIAFTSVWAQKITKESIRSQEKNRTYYLFVPDKIDAGVPVIVTLHGSGRNGLSLVEKWKDIAKKEGIIVAGPDALESTGWRIPADGPDFIRDLVEALKTKYRIDDRRVYLFGHSAGAGQALYLSLLQSEYFAATAVHAGALGAGDDDYIKAATRKIPIAIFVGTNDQSFPLPTVRATRDALRSAGFGTELTEIMGHTHWYYDRAPEINKSAWDFLKATVLGADPKYKQYRWTK